jgi:hypothetical protein
MGKQRELASLCDRLPPGGVLSEGCGTDMGCPVAFEFQGNSRSPSADPMRHAVHAYAEGGVLSSMGSSNASGCQVFAVVNLVTLL